MTHFIDFLLDDFYIEALQRHNIFSPTAVQTAIIPQIIEKKSIIFQSETGTGKTFAYLLPLCSNLQKEHILHLQGKNHINQNPHIIILAPTLELASQIKRQADLLHENAAEDFKIKTALFTGGSPLQRQFDKLKEKPQIIVGTAERIFELINVKKLKVDNISVLVLDEADRLFSRELHNFTEELIKKLPTNLQILACSATITKKVSDTLAQLFPENPCSFCKMDYEQVLTEKITHWIFYTDRQKKIDTLRSLISAVKPQKMLVFSSNASQIENIVDKLQYKKINCMALYAKIDKKARKQALDFFKNGKCSILITSDLAARGLDIQDITHIVQMDFPSNEDFFIHRAGRTARAGKSGINIIIADKLELYQFSKLEKRVKIVIYPKQLYDGKIVSANDAAFAQTEENLK